MKYCINYTIECGYMLLVTMCYNGYIGRQANISPGWVASPSVLPIYSRVDWSDLNVFLRCIILCQFESKPSWVQMT